VHFACPTEKYFFPPHGPKDVRGFKVLLLTRGAKNAGFRAAWFFHRFNLPLSRGMNTLFQTPALFTPPAVGNNYK